jgi:uncharacterized surface protein with fasciclin (FAS1) repeats
MISLNSIKNLFMVFSVGTVLSTTVSSCNKDKESSPQTIADVVNTNPSFTLLKAAVAKAGLGSALSTGTLTVFAPDDAAFAASGITASTINSLSVADLTGILTYHVLGVKVMAADVPASDAVATLQGKNIYASKNANGVFVNGVAVKTADVTAANGVIHVISSVLTPPTKTIAQIAAETPQLSLLLAAVVKAGLAGAVSGPGKYTVFAPTNDAFIAAGFSTTGAINAADAATVASIVGAHVLPTNVFASDLINNAVVPTANPAATITVGITPPSIKLTGSSNPASKIIVPAGVNIIATNGVVHLIDKVIL